MIQGYQIGQHQNGSRSELAPAPMKILLAWPRLLKFAPFLVNNFFWVPAPAKHFHQTSGLASAAPRKWVLLRIRLFSREGKGVKEDKEEKSGEEIDRRAGAMSKPEPNISFALSETLKLVACLVKFQNYLRLQQNSETGSHRQHFPGSSSRSNKLFFGARAPTNKFFQARKWSPPRLPD